MGVQLMRVKSPAGVSLEPITEFRTLKYSAEVSTLPFIEFEVRKDAHGASGLEAEGYVSIPVYAGDYVTWDYIIKDIKYSEGVYNVYAIQDAEAIKNTPFPYYTVAGTLSSFVRQLNSAMSGQNWIFVIESSGIGSVKCEIPENTTVWGAVTSLAEQAGARWVIQQRTQTSVPVTAVVFYANNDWPKTSVVRMFEEINLKNYEKEYNTNDVITKICPIGKDGLLLDGTTQQRMEVPSEANWITDTSKFNKIVPAWVNFDDVETTAELRTQATAYLQTVNAPAVSYALTAVDFRRLTGGSEWPQFNVGTYVEFLDKAGDVIVSSQIVKVELDILNPENNTVELSNVVRSFINSAAAERTQLAKTTATANEALALAKEGGGGGGSTSWANITGKPSTFPPSAHTHTKAEITDFAHTHTKSQITDFAHNHDERYYTESEVDTKLSAKQNTLVSGTNIATINGQSLLDGGDIEIQGGGAGGSLPAVSLGKKDNSTGTQSIGTTITKLNIGTTTTVNSDTAGAYFEVTAGQIKCLKAGVIVVSASVYVSHSSTAGYESLFLYKNGSEQMSDTRYSTGIFTTLNLTTMIAVSAGDYFDIRGRANASSTFYTNNRATTLDIMYLNIEPQKEATGYTLKISNNNAYWNFNIVLADGTTVTERAGTSGTSVYDNVQYLWCAQDAGLRFSKVTNFEEHYNGVVTQKSNDNYVFYNAGAELWLTEDMEIISTWNDD